MSQIPGRKVVKVIKSDHAEMLQMRKADAQVYSGLPALRS